MSFEIAKAGWLFRLSSILKRWKRAWFVLYKDGLLKYFENPDSHEAEDSISLQLKCSNISNYVEGVTPPTNLLPSYLLAIEFHNGDKWTICADSQDDLIAWEMSLKEAKNLNSEFLSSYLNEQNLAYENYGPPPPYYPVQNYYGQPSNANVYPPYMVQQYPNQPTTIIYTDHPNYHRYRNNDGTDMAVGMMAGAAIGSMLWGPFMWW